MRYLFGSRSNLENFIRDKEIILFLDYDGTLTNIAKTPQEAVLSKKVKSILKSLVSGLNYKIVIISGRSLNDIIKIIGLKGIIYVGNHGLQIKGPGIRFLVHISQGYRRLLKVIKKKLNDELSLYKGVLIENKDFILSLHYRLVNKKYIKKIKNIFYSITKKYLLRHKIKLKEGKMVLEIRPSLNWNKGKAVLWLLSKKFKEKGIFPIYIGDDKTDEDAFKILRMRGLTIFVGKPKESSAQYYVRDVNEVTLFLNYLLKIKNNV
ncbi:MAG: trehalose-phosphatase [Candidatus Omnitrophica bacterium]|nr:trehalose-phosphatase [Candidatus Omnitrophota bacterium]